MPSIRGRVTTTTGDALTGRKFKIIPPRGAVLTLLAAGVTNSDDVGLSINDRELLAQGTDINIEASADVIDWDRDILLQDEVVIPGGELFLPVTVTTEMQFLLVIKYL